MVILLTGATGFLGSYLLKSFVESGHQVIALKRSMSDTDRINGYLEKVICYNIDEIEISSIFKNHAIDIVVNTVTNYGRKDTKISSIVETNLMFGLNLLEVSVANNIKAFINTDTLLERNLNAYALSKAQLVDWMSFLSCNTTKMINIKIEHMYGPKDDENKFIYWLIHQLKQNVAKIDLTSGVQKRDFIYIDDIISAYTTIINNLDAMSNFEEFELGSGSSIEVKMFVEQLATQLKAISTTLNFGAISYRANENMHMQADITKLKRLGWKPEVSVETGIKNILKEEK